MNKPFWAVVQNLKLVISSRTIEGPCQKSTSPHTKMYFNVSELVFWLVSQFSFQQIISKSENEFIISLCIMHSINDCIHIFNIYEWLVITSKFSSWQEKGIKKKFKHLPFPSKFICSSIWNEKDIFILCKKLNSSFCP